MERRQQERCPICHGPALRQAGAPDGIRCRRSICTHNHAHIACPRCQKRELESVSFKDGRYHYVCGECLNSWSKDD